MSNDNNIKKNYIFNVLYQILLVITPVITIPYLSKIFGADGIGEISFKESVVSYFMIFASLGITTFGQREIAYYKDNRNKLSEVFYNIFFLKLIISLIVLLIYILLCIFYFKSIIYIAFSISIVSVIVDITWFFNGKEEFLILISRNSIFKILNILFIFLFIKTKNDIVLYCISIGLFTVITNLSLIPSLRKYILFVEYNKLRPFDYLKGSLSLFLPTIAIQVYTVLDKTMIGVITKSDLENGYYEQSIKISRFLLLIVTALSTVASPKIAYYFKKNDSINLKRMIYTSYRFVMMSSIPMALLLFAISDNLVPWFLGKEFMKSIVLIKVLSCLILFIGLSNVTGIQYLVPTNQQNKLTISVVFGAVINFTLNIFLIYYFKSVGASIASIIAELSITLIQFYVARNEISLFRILKDSINYFISGIIMFFAIFVISLSLPPSLLNTFLLITIASIIYLTMLIVLKDEYLISNLLYIRIEVFKIFKWNIH